MRIVKIFDDDREKILYNLSVADEEFTMLRDSGAIYEDEGDDAEADGINHIGVNLAWVVDLLAGFQPERFDNKVSIYISNDTRTKLVWFLQQPAFKNVTYDMFLRRAIRAAAKGAVKVFYEHELDGLEKARGHPPCTCGKGGFKLECALHGDWYKRYADATKAAVAFTQKENE
jgi:hypothetical protein